MSEKMTSNSASFASATLTGQPFRPGSSRIAVLGAGVMGPGIAQVFAEHGFHVDLCETAQAALDRGSATLRDNLRLKVELNLLAEESAAAVLARVTPHLGSEAALSGATLVIEAVTENKDVKRRVYEQVQKMAGPSTVVWSNTSTMNVFELAEAPLRSRLVIAHWFAPPHILPLVEVVGEEQTSEILLAETFSLLRGLGKVPVRLGKFVPGFLINRLLRALGREAFHLIECGAISIEDLDVAVRTSLAPRMQVLGLMQRYDYTGLKLSMRNLSDPAMSDAPIDLAPSVLKDRVDRGDLGIATGRGFYDYSGRSTLDLQRERDIRLWRVMQGLMEFASDPKPI